VVSHIGHESILNMFIYIYIYAYIKNFLPGIGIQNIIFNVKNINKLSQKQIFLIFI